jgi:type IV pilus assembly protein PilQ
MGDKVSIRVIDDSGESSTQLVETGIKLTVTPHVSGDNRILLDLHPENNSYDYDSKGEIVISTQEAKTKVVVADGETVIIGGLTRNETQESESGIPFLKDIPFFGNLFKYTRHSVVKKDLVIFVTPRIIRNYIGNVELSEPSAEVAEQGAPQMQKVDAPAAQPAPQAAPAAQPAAQQQAPAADASTGSATSPAPAHEPAPAAEPAPASEPAAETPAAPEPATNDVQDDWN